MQGNGGWPTAHALYEITPHLWRTSVIVVGTLSDIRGCRGSVSRASLELQKNQLDSRIGPASARIASDVF